MYKITRCCRVLPVLVLLPLLANSFAPQQSLLTRGININNQKPPFPKAPLLPFNNHYVPGYRSRETTGRRGSRSIGAGITTTTCLHALPIPLPALGVLRGGARAAATAAAINMSRESLKLQSMTQYSTITALIMNASLRLYTSQKFDKNPKDGSTRWIQHFFVAMTTMCIISGAFTACTFNILTIYSKECLGMQNDCGYFAFQNATAIYRKWGFRSFLSTLIGFVGSFLISLYEKSQASSNLNLNEHVRSRGVWIFSISTLVALLAAYHIHEILGLATLLIYTPEACSKNRIAYYNVGKSIVTKLFV